MVLYSKRTNQQIVLIRPGTIADVEKLENRKPDKEDIERTESGYRAVGRIIGKPDLLLFDLAYVNATAGAIEAHHAFGLLGCKVGFATRSPDHYPFVLQAGNAEHEMIIRLLGVELHSGQEIIKTTEGDMAGQALQNVILYARTPIMSEEVKMFIATIAGAGGYFQLIDYLVGKVTTFKGFLSTNTETDNAGDRIYKGQAVCVITLEGSFTEIETKKLLVFN